MPDGPGLALLRIAARHPSSVRENVGTAAVEDGVPVRRAATQSPVWPDRLTLAVRDALMCRQVVEAHVMRSTTDSHSARLEREGQLGP